MKTRFIPRHFASILCFGLAVGGFQPQGHAESIEKAANIDNLNLTSSWVGGAVPGADDIAVWRNAVTGNNWSTMGAHQSWAGIILENVQSGGTAQVIRIDGVTQNHTLTLGSSGIDATAYQSSFQLFAPVALGANQHWNFGTTGRLHYAGALNNHGYELTVSSAQSITFQGSMSGTGNLVLNGAGAKVFTGNSTFTGSTTLNGGTVQFGNYTAAGSVGSGLITGTGDLALARSDSFTVGNTLSGNIRVVQYGSANPASPNVVTLTGDNTNNAATLIRAGGISVSSINSVVGGKASSNLGTPTSAVNGRILFGNAAATGALIYTGEGETTDRELRLQGTTGGAILDHSGTGHLKFTGAMVADGAGSKMVTLQGSTSGTGELAMAVTNYNATHTTGILKKGSGTWTLSGNNTYTGDTDIEGGTLIVTGSLTNASSVTVGNSEALEAAAILRGTGKVGNVVVGVGAGNSGATLALGTDAAVGNLTVESVSFTGQATNFFVRLGGTNEEPNAGGNHDLLTSVGTVNFNGANLELDLLSGFSAGGDGLYFLLNNESSQSGGGENLGLLSFDGSTLNQDDLFTVNGVEFQISYNADFASRTFTGAGNDVAIFATAIPEPTTVVFLLGSASALLMWGRRSRKA